MSRSDLINFGKVIKKGKSQKVQGVMFLLVTKFSLGHPCRHLTICIILDSIVFICPHLVLFPIGQKAQPPARA